MIVDYENEYSDAQALTATAASEHVIDHGAAGDVGEGEAMGIVITCDVALAGTSPTLDIELQQDTAAAFPSPSGVISLSQITAMGAGDKKVLPVPPGALLERASRLNYTLGGTTPTVTLSASLMPLRSIPNWRAYADAI